MSLLFSSAVRTQKPASFLFNTENGLPTNEVYAAFETNEGQLYVGHDLGLSVYNGESFLLLQPPGLMKGVSCLRIKKNRKKIWFYFGNKNLFYLEDSKLIPYRHNSIIENLDYSLLFDFDFTKDSLYLHTESGYYSLDKNGNAVFKNLSKNGLEIDSDKQIVKRYIHKILEPFEIIVNQKNYGSFSAGTKNQHFGEVINSKSEYFCNSFYLKVLQDRLIKIDLNKILTDFEDCSIISVTASDSLLFFSTRNNGVLVFQFLNQTLKLRNHLLSGAYVGIISNGPSGLWVPDLKNGLHFFPNYSIRNFKLSPKATNIYTYNSSIFLTQSLPNSKNDVKVISADETISSVDTIQFSTTFIDYLFDNKKSKLRLREIEDDGMFFKIRALSFESHPICKIPAPYNYSYENENFFLSCTNNFIHLISKENQAKDTLYQSGIVDITKVRENIFFASGKFGLLKITIENDQLKAHKIDTPANILVSLKKATEDLLIIATEKSVYSFDINTSKYTRLYRNGEDVIRKVHFKDSLLFIGMKSYLQVYDIPSKRNCFFTKSDGLCSSNIIGIEEIDEKLVVNTEEGISLIPFNLILKKLKTKKVDYNQYFKLYVNEDVLNVEIKINELNPWNEQHIEYKLNNQNYQVVAEKRFKLANLRAGNYEIQFRIRKGNEKWNYLEPMYFEIPTPFYARWWFSSSLFLILGFIFYLIIRRRNQIKTKKLQTEKLIETLRMNALTTQMNPHFLYNALNTIQGLLNEDKRKVFIYVSDLARFFRLMLNNSSEIYIPIEKEVALNEVFCEIENVRQFNKVKLITHYENESLGKYLIPSMILQPFIENALWHAFTKEIKEPQIQLNIVELNNQTIKIEIIDNGIGINKTKSKRKAHQSKGVSIVENRLKIFNEENPAIPKNIIFTDLNNNPNTTGTKVEVYLTKQETYDLQDLNH